MAVIRLFLLVKEENEAGILMPNVKKETLFAYVQANGSCPRKTFSIGEAPDKRYYLEVRKIA